MSETIDKREALKEKGIGVIKPIQSDNPAVEQTKLKMEALNTLADKSNEVFSSHFVDKVGMTDETRSFEKACLFANNPLPGYSERLESIGINFDLSIKIVPKFVGGILERRHSMNRSRVEEYLKGLKNLNRPDVIEQPERKGILSRLG